MLSVGRYMSYGHCFRTFVLFGCFIFGEKALSQESSIVLRDKVLEASGGLDAWRSIVDGRYTQRTISYDESGLETSSDSARHFFKHSDRGILYRIEQDTPRGKMVLGFDGANAWRTFDGIIDTASAAAPQARIGATASYYWFALPFKWGDRGTRFATAGEDLVNGEPVSVLEVTFEKDIGDSWWDRFHYYINEKTGHIDRIRYWQRSGGPDGPEGQTDAFWDDYRKVGPITKNLRRAYYRPDGTLVRAFVLENVQFNQSLEDVLFIRP